MASAKEVIVGDCMKRHFQVLAWVGFYRPIVDYNNKVKRVVHKVYRYVVLALMILYNLQHAVFAMQSAGDMDNLIAASIILLTTINNICKIFTLYLNTTRLQRIMTVINGPYFAPLDDFDHKILERNSKVMNMILKPCFISVTLCCTMWCISPFINRAKGVEVVIPAYYPFNTDSLPGFTAMVLYQNILMAWVGIGHTTIDCVIASFYIQIRAQLQILRQHLLHIADSDTKPIFGLRHRPTAYGVIKYKDLDRNYFKRLQDRFAYNVKKYEIINWVMDEVQSIFNNAIVVQLLVSACILCVVVYKMVQTVSLSFDFFYLFQYNFSLGMQLFLYCYFGTQVEYESYYVNDSLYASEWTTLSPKFRRQMTIAMARWSRAMKPRAAYVIPLSLATFVGVLKTSYSLYTLLKKTSN